MTESTKSTTNMQKLKKYLGDTAAELKQVSWPSQNQAIMYTLIVIGITAAVALFVSAFDFIFSQGINFFVNSF